tara:strand:+ start:8373 stop:9626 length:1254 start_codon:yes stop_codon:yes gene_type:complete
MIFNKIRLTGTLLAICTLCFASACEQKEEVKNSSEFLSEHVEWLSSVDREGRFAGSIQEADAANYIADQFLVFGLEPMGDDFTYLQQFTLSGPMAQSMDSENVISRNVIGDVVGTQHPNRVIVIGAHYDGQGRGGIISMDHDGEPAIHPSADDNASGTAGLLYLARYFSQNPPENTIRFIAFSGEELGLLGSRFYTNTMDTYESSVMAMINLDMIGRLTDDNFTVFGTGTANVWEDILKSAESDSLTVNQIAGGSGSSDHTSFYDQGIPVLHYFSGTHPDYHSPTDTADKINYPGMEMILGHVKRVVEELDQMDLSEIDFQESTSGQTQTMNRDGATLGVMPDYSYSGDGFRIDAVREGQPGDLGGLEDGDIIIQLGDFTVADIYSYMEGLSEYEKGDQVVVKIMRNGTEMNIEITF